MTLSRPRGRAQFRRHVKLAGGVPGDLRQLAESGLDGRRDALNVAAGGAHQPAGDTFPSANACNKCNGEKR